MVDEETSAFLKKYKQILNFKNRAKKRVSSESNNNHLIHHENSNKIISKNNISVLPKLNSMKKNSSSLKYANEEWQKNNSIIIKKNKGNINYISVNNTGKEYRNLIKKYANMAPKKNVEAISDELYKRLLNQNEKDYIDEEINENTILNYKEEKKKPKIILPFLANVQSRYNNYNDKKYISNESNNYEKIANTKKVYISAKNSDHLAQKEKKYYYLILPGNNSALVEKCLLTRPCWRKIKNNNNTIKCNFIWTELSQEINFPSHNDASLSQIINHFENHNEISNKKNLFINLLKYCVYNKIDLFSFFPLTIILSFNKEYFNDQIELFKQIYIEMSSLVEGTFDNEETLDNYFKYHFVRRKNNSLKITVPKSHYTGKNVWVLKRINLNRGREIKVVRDLDSIINIIENSKKEKKYSCLIIQKYIENTLLYNNRKFDIRIWVLISYLSKNDKYEVYVFKEGHLKACSETFNINSDDLYVHLTNYSVQKYNKNFSKEEVGNEISFELFQNELDKKGIKKNFKKDIFPKILRIIAISTNAAKTKINILARRNCFEIFGYDIILDGDCQPFLLEINTNPGLEESSPLIKMLVPRMIDDAFRLTIDELFERNDKDSNVSIFKVDGYSDEENMWQKVNCKI